MSKPYAKIWWYGSWFIMLPMAILGVISLTIIAAARGIGYLGELLDRFDRYKYGKLVDKCLAWRSQIYRKLKEASDD